MKLEFSRQILEIYSNIKFHENPFSRSRFVPCGRTDRQTDMTKLIVAFAKYMKAPKSETSFKVLRKQPPMTSVTHDQSV